MRCSNIWVQEALNDLTQECVMTSFDLAAFSNAVADIAEQAAPVTASFLTHHGRTATAFHWGEGLYVAAEESVEPDEELQLALPSGETVKAELIGRDPSTGIALLKPSTAAGVRASKRPGRCASATSSSRPGVTALRLLRCSARWARSGRCGAHGAAAPSTAASTSR